MKVIFDSNVWIAFLNSEDSQHKKAVEIFKQNTQKVIVPEYVVLEVASILQIRSGQIVANKFLNGIEKSKNVKILLSSQGLFLKTNRLFQAQKQKKLAFVDCALLLLSSGIKVITFDKALEKEIGSLVN